MREEGSLKYSFLSSARAEEEEEADISERKFTGRWKGNQVKLKAQLLARGALYILRAT